MARRTAAWIGVAAALALLSACGRRAEDAPVEGQAAPSHSAAGDTALAPARAGEAATLEGDAALAAKLCRMGLAGEMPPTLFGHIKQADVAAGSLVPAPAGFNISACQAMDAGMAASLRAMIGAARADDPAVGANLAGVSCHRSAARQRDLYCRADWLAQRGFAGQAFWVAPPGYSEHATGRAIDFGDRSRPDCNVSPCFGGTAVGRWLASNAARFGFRMSFPPGNAQGVAAEPWHFRWVGGGAGMASSPDATPATAPVAEAPAATLPDAPPGDASTGAGAPPVPPTPGPTPAPTAEPGLPQ